jgi:hypothetical protein
MPRFTANGYEITTTGNETVLIDRRTWGLGWLMVALGLVGVVLLALGGLSRAQPVKPSIGSSVAALFAGGGLLLLAGLVGGIYRKRNARPVEEIEDALVLDRAGRVLRSRMGEIAVPLADVKARMHIDWWTRATMRVVVLSWPGGHRTVYRAFGRSRCLDVLHFFAEQGVDAQ